MEGKRPGGLTALAVVNFIFGGLGLLGMLALAAIMVLFLGVAEATENSENEMQQQIVEAWQEVGLPAIMLLVGLGLVVSVLLIVSGIGYLKQKRFLGRTLGTAYGVLGILSNALSAALTPVEQGGGMNLGLIIGLVYPVLTLLLLNTTFKHDFHD